MHYIDDEVEDEVKHHVHYEDDDIKDEGNEICVDEWVEKPEDRPILCSFLMPSRGRKDEMKYTFDMSKFDRLFDLLLRGGVF
jgi:hypothetical protein